MSADNGWILQLRKDGRYSLQHYMASADELPNPEQSQLTFTTIEGAVMHFAKAEEDAVYKSEYGLSVNFPTNKKPPRHCHYIDDPDVCTSLCE